MKITVVPTPSDLKVLALLLRDSQLQAGSFTPVRLSLAEVVGRPVSLTRLDVLRKLVGDLSDGQVVIEEPTLPRPKIIILPVLATQVYYLGEGWLEATLNAALLPYLPALRDLVGPAGARPLVP